MKIIAINGSPHKGNTCDQLTEIEQILIKHDDVEFETINLKDLTINPCKGCFICFIKGSDKCPLKDDREIIEKKIEEADGVIFASPVYSMHISYLMKTMIDRMAYTFHRPRYFGKYAITIAVAGNIGLKETNEYLSEVATAWGFIHLDSLPYRLAPKNTPMKIPPLKKDNTERIVERFHTTIKGGKPQKLTFRDHLTFRIMQTVYQQLDTMSPYDYQYWNERGWFDKKTKYFYSQVKRNIFFDGISRFFAWMMGRQLNKEFDK
jgi:multimeric flavodoxin WrbA